MPTPQKSSSLGQKRLARPDGTLVLLADQVMLSAAANAARDRFVDSNLLCFVEFLCEYQHYLDVPEGSPAQERSRVTRLQGRLSAIDPAALADPKNERVAGNEWVGMLEALRWEVGLWRP